MTTPNYPMLFEAIILAAWGKTWRSTDPFKMGDADTLAAVDDDLSGKRGHNAKFVLPTALNKVGAENNSTDDVYNQLMMLDEQLWEAKNYNDLCVILRKTEKIFNKLGFNIA